MPIKKIAAAALSFLMFLSLLPAALADTPAPGRIEVNSGGLANVSGVYDSANGLLTYYLAAEPEWTEEGSYEFIRINTSIAKPEGAEKYTINNSECFPLPGATLTFNIRYDKPSGAPQTMETSITLQWCDENETPFAADTLDIRIVPAYYPLPVPAGKLGHPSYDTEDTPESLLASQIASGDGIMLYRLKEGVTPDGVDAVTTYVAPPDELLGAAYQYRLDGGAKTAGSGNHISIADVIPALNAPEPHDVLHTLEWYSSDGSLLVATQRFTTRFKLKFPDTMKPFDYSSLNTANLTAIGCTLDIVTITDQNGQEQQCLDIFLPQKDAEEWKNLFFGGYNSSSAIDSFMVRAAFPLPVDTQWYAYINSSLTVGDSQGIDVMNTEIPAGFRADPRNASWSFTFASVTYDGRNAVLIPLENERSLLIKYMDAEDELQYTRINYRIRYGSPNTSYIMEDVAPLGSRVITDPAFSGEYRDGTISYTIRSYGGGTLSLVARLAPPVSIAANAAMLRINNQSPVGIADGYANYSYPYSGDRNQFTAPLKLEWLDAHGSVLFREMMSINIIPAFSGKWVHRFWQPVAQGRTSAHSAAVAAGARLSYDPAEGIWRFTIDESSLDAGYFTRPYSDLVFVSPPPGAAHYIVYLAHGLLYSGTDFEDGVKSFFQNEETSGLYESIPANGAPVPLPFRQPCRETVMDAANGDVTVFTVNKTMIGYANYAVIQWYDDEYNHIPSSAGDEGEYVLLVMDPYYRSVSSQITQTPVPATSQTGPTAVSSRNDSLSYQLKAEIPLQKNSSEDTDYLVMDLTYLDQHGKEIQPTAGESVTIYLPYPDGVTYQNAGQYDFSLRHYKSGDLNGESELVELVPTEYGLRFTTDSFSPFLRGCTRKSGTDTKAPVVPWHQITYAGSKSFRTNGVVKRIEVDHTEVLFEQDGSDLIIPSLTDGGHSIQVIFNDGSMVIIHVNAYDTADDAVDIPQTGDAPLTGLGVSLIPATAMLACAILLLRKKAKH